MGQARGLGDRSTAAHTIFVASFQAAESGTCAGGYPPTLHLGAVSLPEDLPPAPCAPSYELTQNAAKGKMNRRPSHSRCSPIAPHVPASLPCPRPAKKKKKGF